MNFHRDLLAMNTEVHYWERLRMPIPYIAMEINAQRDKYRVLRDNILMVSSAHWVIDVCVRRGGRSTMQAQGCYPTHVPAL
jgi:hypothetical protein